MLAVSVFWPVVGSFSVHLPRKSLVTQQTLSQKNKIKLPWYIGYTLGARQEEPADCGKGILAEEGLIRGSRHQERWNLARNLSRSDYSTDLLGGEDTGRNDNYRTEARGKACPSNWGDGVSCSCNWNKTAVAITNTNLLEESVVCWGGCGLISEEPPSGFHHCYSMVFSASGAKGERVSE